MKILYVISTLGGGGAESQLFTFCNCLREKTDNCFSVLALKEGGAIETRFKEQNIQYQVLHSKSILKSIIGLHKLVKKEKYDIVILDGSEMLDYADSRFLANICDDDPSLMGSYPFVYIFFSFS